MGSNNRNWLDKFVEFVQQYDFKEDEEFREIVNYSCRKRWFISNYGTIITLYYGKWRIRKPEHNKKDGHLYIKLDYNGKRITKGVHQLVAECFIKNSAPTIKTQIHHIDFNPLNNYYLNLCYVSPKEHRAIHEKHNKELVEKRLKNYAKRANS